MPPEMNFAERVTKRRISLGELREYLSTPAYVAEDVVASSGVVLLPRGTELAALVSSVEDVEKNLRRWGIFSIPIIFRNSINIQEMEGILKTAEANLMRVDPELARNTVEQVSNVYGRIVEGIIDPEDYANLANQGRTLAREVAQAPQVMLCLGRVRSWDEYTYVHSLNVALLGGFLASRLYPDQPDIAESLSVGGILHDLGKAHVPRAILNKPGPLTKEEFEIIKKHSEYGEELAIANGITDVRVLSVVRGHHERCNGEGYPDRFTKEQIRKEAKIAAVADVFDALTAKRVYKEPIDSRVAVSMMIDNTGTHFAPEVVRVLLMSIGLYPPGTAVELSDGSLGAVIGAKGKDLMRPQVLLQIDSMGRKVEGVKVVDLSEDPSLYVQRSLQDVGKLEAYFPSKQAL
ncbi:MAG: HD-GYP domain-containing protein [Synergistaceae bacterium]|jgi:HD-GYP domain-containing protein (c-di-GMP phosphodiesterase class II)|nr:HD-GYP domain-containing protein [Synergistaceae bacterium]